MDKANIFNIPANYDFFESVFCWLEKKYKNELSEVKIFLPNRRACRKLREVFMAKNLNLILPKIKAISDISYEDFFDFLPEDSAKKIIDELLQIKVLNGVDYLFFLSLEIQKLAVFGDNLDFDQSFKIALRLQDLFNEIEREEIDLKKLSEIDDSDLSSHRQLTLEFLKNFHSQIKNSLLKKGISFSTSNQNFIIQEFIKLLEKHGSKAPIIIAGSTGSISFSKKLIKAISKQRNCQIILYSSWQDNLKTKDLAENHPQFFLNRLIKFLEVEKLENFADEKFLLSDEIRQNLLSLMFLPFEETIKWQKLEQFLDIKKAANDIEKNFQFLEARNEIEEAKIIFLILKEALEENKKSALVSNNSKLISLVKSELEAASLSFNDSRNLGIFDSKLINFLLLILEIQESDFDSHTLLALLKNPLCFHSQDKKLLADFEINVLRQERVKSGLEGIKEKLKSDKKLESFFTDFCNNLPTFSPSLADLISSLIKSVEKLSKKSWQDLLRSEPAQIEIFEFFEKLKLQKNIFLNSKNLVTVFKNLFSQISFFEKSDATAPIQILSPLEARLLNFDLMIISSLNEGDFPEIESENWLGKKIKKDLEIDKSAKKIGQSAYDFCNYLSNHEVIMTRSKTRNGRPVIQSPFLLKFKTICNKIAAKPNQGEKYFSLLKKLDSTKPSKIDAPNPKPKIEFRPQRISITEISKLISNPYFIYAKKILQLKELQKIDFEPSYAEFGSFVHKALEEFVKNPQTKNFSQIFEKYFISQDSKLIWLPKFEKIFSNFIIENQKFLGNKNYVEISVKLALEKILISGKIDRVIIDEEENLNIFDYKTGVLPTKKSVLEGIEPQLTLAALALTYGMIESELKNADPKKIKSLNYWKLSASSLGKITQIAKNNEEIQILLSAAKAGLSKLFEYFSDENNGYIATAEDKKFNEYKHLIRTEEWDK